MTRMHIRSELDVETYLEPSLIVSSDGSIQALNRAARSTLSHADVNASLFALCASPVAVLESYLARCSNPGPPSIERLSFQGDDGVSEYRCFGSALAGHSQGDVGHPAILLRLFLAPDEVMTAEVESTTVTIAEMRWQLALRQVEELRRERQRLDERQALLAEALRMVEAQKRELHAEMKHIRTDERDRIALDLHDQIGQEMAGVLQELRQLRDGAVGLERDHLDAVAEHVSEIGRRIHRAVIGGKPRIVEELGLARALEATGASFATDGGLDFSFVCNGTAPVPSPAAIEGALYRVAQEAMTNVIKHASGARKLTVTLQFSAQFVSLAVADDGAGFLPEALSRDGRGDDACVGLRGMQQRMRGVAGTLKIDSRPGKGTAITACVPLAPDPKPSAPP